jgi:hypothetical protein
VQCEDGVAFGLAEGFALVGVVAVVGLEGVLGGEDVALELDEVGGEVWLVVGHDGRLPDGRRRGSGGTAESHSRCG